MTWAVLPDRRTGSKLRIICGAKVVRDPAYAMDFNLPLSDPDLDDVAAPSFVEPQVPSNEDLCKLADANPPHEMWLEGDEECPFI